MNADDKLQPFIEGITPDILLAKSIPELYSIFEEKVKKISDITGFLDVDIFAATDADWNIIKANADMGNVGNVKPFYTTLFTGKQLETLLDREKPVDEVRQAEFGMPFKINDTFEMPRSDKQIDELIRQGTLPASIIDDLKEDYKLHKTRMQQAGKKPITFKVWRGGLHVPIYIGGGQPVGVASFSCPTNDANKHPDIANLALADPIPGEYKELVKQITKHFAPVIAYTMQLYLKEDKNKELERAYAKLESATEEIAAGRAREAAQRITHGVLHDVNNLVTDTNLSFRPVKRAYSKLESFVEQIKQLEAVTDPVEYKKQVALLTSSPLMKELEKSKGKVPYILGLFGKTSKLLSDLENDQAYEFKPMTLEPIIDEVIESMDERLGNAVIQTNYTTKPYSISGDELHIDRAIRNILINFNESTANQEYKQIDIGTEVSDEYVRLSFKDNGPGIEPDNISKVFEPYFSTKGMKDSRERGLGLYIVANTVAAHNGKVSVNSDNGAIFNLDFPLE